MPVLFDRRGRRAATDFDRDRLAIFGHGIADRSGSNRWRRGGLCWLCSASEVFADLLGLFISETCQRRSFAGDSDFLDQINEIFTVEIQFFCERVNACGHVEKILSIRLGTRRANMMIR